MPAIGYIQVHAYESYAQIPLKDVAVSVVTADGTALATRLTDRSGRIAPIELPVPELAASQSPDPAEQPFTAVDINARLQGYEQIRLTGVQIFADTVTVQNLEMIPLSELPDQFDRGEQFSTPPQNL